MKYPQTRINRLDQNHEPIWKIQLYVLQQYIEMISRDEIFPPLSHPITFFYMEFLLSLYQTGTLLIKGYEFHGQIMGEVPCNMCQNQSQALQPNTCHISEFQKEETNKNENIFFSHHLQLLFLIIKEEIQNKKINSTAQYQLLMNNLLFKNFHKNK